MVQRTRTRVHAIYPFIYLTFSSDLLQGYIKVGHQPKRAATSSASAPKGHYAFSWGPFFAFLLMADRRFA